MEASSQGSTPERLGAALDPRERIYRDPFNELVVFVLSAAGAAVVVPAILLIVGALLDEQFDFWIFVAASVLLELVLIFGVARPQMKPRERVGWALLWGFTAAVLGAAFWELVFQPAV
jgi:hypothetical protein